MALNYYYSDVANANTVMFDEDDYMRPDTQTIIFSTMSVGLGEITSDNWIEFYSRMRIVQKILGHSDPIPPSRVKEHIGLRTNVNNETRAKWMKRWIGYEIDEIIREATRECESKQSVS